MKTIRLFHTRISILLLLCGCLAGCQEENVIVQSLLDLSGAPLSYDDSQANKFLNVVSASIQVSHDKASNIAELKRICNLASREHPETELILFGESILGWYVDEEDPEGYQQKIAEPIPGPATQTLAMLADSLNIYLVFGLTEKRRDTLFNSQVLLNPSGQLEAVHRKIHLTPEDLENGMEAGAKSEENITLVTINDIRCGMIVCADQSGYWLTEQLVNKEVELILHSLASQVSEFSFDPVARQFNAWEVFANRYGQEGSRLYSGTTYIADPAGTIRSGASGSALYMYHRIAVR
jgi:predicted amidohydrolase